MNVKLMVGKLVNYSLICVPFLVVPMSAHALEPITVPEPSAIGILIAGLVILGLVSRKK